MEEALEIDEESGTDFWRKALGKEKTKVKVAWRTADGVTPEQAGSRKESTMIGFQEIRCHVIFDVKMDFTRKARFVVLLTRLDQSPDPVLFRVTACDSRFLSLG